MAIDRTAARRGIAVAITALAVGMTTACGTAGPTGGSSAAPGAPGSEAGASGSTVWIMSGTSEAAFNSSFQRWNEANPDEAFGAETFANDAYKQKIRPAIGAGDAPTLIYGWGGGGLMDYVDAGAVTDLTDLYEGSELKDTLLPSVAATGKVDGKVYALPNNVVKPVMLYYNKDVFDKVGADVPATWDDLMALVPTFVDAGIAPFSVAGQAQWPLLPYFSYLVDRIGGPEVMQAVADGEADAWSDPAITEALEKIQDLVDAGGFVKGFASISTDGGADAALLYGGKAAMMLGLPATFQNIQTGNPDFIEQGKLGWAPFPAVEGGKGDPANVTGNPSNYWSVSASDTEEAQQAAKDYLAQMMDDQYIDDLIATGGVPPVTGIEDKLAAADNGDYLSALYELVEKAPNFQLSLDQAITPAAATELLGNLQQIFLKQSTPQQFVDAMNATIGK